MSDRKTSAGSYHQYETNMQRMTLEVMYGIITISRCCPYGTGETSPS